jgi:hypothetical protein
MPVLPKGSMTGLTFHSALDQLGIVWPNAPSRLLKFTAVKKPQIDIGNRDLSCDRSDALASGRDVSNRRRIGAEPTAGPR